MSRALTDRQAEIMALVAEGLTNKRIALKLGISEQTVKNHLQATYGIMGVDNRVMAVRNLLDCDGCIEIRMLDNMKLSSRERLVCKRILCRECAEQSQRRESL